MKKNKRKILKEMIHIFLILFEKDKAIYNTFDMSDSFMGYELDRIADLLFEIAKVDITKDINLDMVDNLYRLNNIVDPRELDEAIETFLDDIA